MACSRVRIQTLLAGTGFFRALVATESVHSRATAAESRRNNQFLLSFQCLKSDPNHLCDILELSGASFVTHLSEESPKMRHECSEMGLGLFRNFTFACPPPGPAIDPICKNPVRRQAEMRNRTGTAVRWRRIEHEVHSGISFLCGGSLRPNLSNQPSRPGFRRRAPLVVADSAHNRVLIWNHIPSSNKVPDSVVGQKNVVSVGIPGDTPGAQSMRGPQLQNGKLYVVDTRNNRVLIFNRMPPL